MTTDPDTMNAEQLRDALADAAGWTRRGGKWDVKSGHDGPFASLGTMRAFEKGHPIPPLDSPEAMGVVAGMMPVPPMPHTIRVYREACVVEYFEKCDDGSSLRRAVIGRTETIARARLVLKVLAATKTPAV